MDTMDKTIKILAGAFLVLMAILAGIILTHEAPAADDRMIGHIAQDDMPCTAEYWFIWTDDETGMQYMAWHYANGTWAVMYA